MKMLVAAVAAALSIPAAAQAAEDQGKIILEARLRAEFVDQDLMSGDRALMAELGIDRMRLGDLVVIPDADHRFGRGYRAGAVTTVTPGSCVPPVVEVARQFVAIALSAVTEVSSSDGPVPFAAAGHGGPAAVLASGESMPDMFGAPPQPVIAPRVLLRLLVELAQESRLRYRVNMGLLRDAEQERGTQQECDATLLRGVSVRHRIG